ncbi:unnamed protein product [Owenia fusiformis]|uniref:Uncharacterized protein n=1 Tax=Owenia fusiformis TaxID=6347 RepID=A0A8J1TR20_OWEFU|nr:unnamed protein product [Owenia fusiformis]
MSKSFLLHLTSRITRSNLAGIHKQAMRPKRKAVADTEVKAKRAKGETDLRFDLKWSEGGKLLKNLCPLLYLSSESEKGCNKVAGFDIDWTVIGTRSGRAFASGPKDWKWLYDCVPSKLKQLNEDGYRVIFFSNQAGIEKNKVNPDDFRKKLEDIIAELDIPVFVYASTGNNHFRKPSPNMWKYFIDHNNADVQVDLSQSMYVGDAAGREKGWKKDKKKDFSCSDRMFAANVGIDFHTPEEFFLGEEPAPFKWQSLDPAKYLETISQSSCSSNKYHANNQEIAIMVGCPASGKSTFAKLHFVANGYVHINRDTLGNAAKCIKATQDALKAGKSVVIDNTNPSPLVRADYMQLAKKFGVPARCFVMSTPQEVAHHLNYVRQNQTNGEIRRIPMVAYHSFKKNHKIPELSEGFSEIINVTFEPKFTSKKHEELFKQWTSSER